MSVGLNVVERF